MLSLEALRERQWGRFPALRQALEKEKIPDHYYGWTSVSDNIFSSLPRLVEQAILAQEYKEKILETATSIGKEQMYKDLILFESALKQAASYFENAILTVERLRRSL